MMKTKALIYSLLILLSVQVSAQVKQNKNIKKPPVAASEAVIEKLDRSIRPNAAPAPVIKLGEYQSFELVPDR
ncbi:MAG: hypothetical protein IPH45_13720 [Bacteroidales bacterium]|nr:hypothetical protein [Bacteroidales bacterium]